MYMYIYISCIVCNVLFYFFQVKVLCKVDSVDLGQLLLVSKTVSEAVRIASVLSIFVNQSIF